MIRFSYKLIGLCLQNCWLLLSIILVTTISVVSPVRRSFRAALHKMVISKDTLPTLYVDLSTIGITKRTVDILQTLIPCVIDSYSISGLGSIYSSGKIIGALDFSGGKYSMPQFSLSACVEERSSLAFDVSQRGLRLFANVPITLHHVGRTGLEFMSRFGVSSMILSILFKFLAIVERVLTIRLRSVDVAGDVLRRSHGTGLSVGVDLFLWIWTIPLSRFNFPILDLLPFPSKKHSAKFMRSFGANDIPKSLVKRIFVDIDNVELLPPKFLVKSEFVDKSSLSIHGSMGGTIRVRGKLTSSISKSKIVVTISDFTATPFFDGALEGDFTLKPTVASTDILDSILKKTAIKCHSVVRVSPSSEQPGLMALTVSVNRTSLLTKASTDLSLQIDSGIHIASGGVLRFNSILSKAVQKPVEDLFVSGSLRAILEDIRAHLSIVDTDGNAFKTTVAVDTSTTCDDASSVELWVKSRKNFPLILSYALRLPVLPEWGLAGERISLHGRLGSFDCRADHSLAFVRGSMNQVALEAAGMRRSANLSWDSVSGEFHNLSGSRHIEGENMVLTVMHEFEKVEIRAVPRVSVTDWFDSIDLGSNRVDVARSLKRILETVGSDDIVRIVQVLFPAAGLWPLRLHEGILRFLHAMQNDDAIDVLLVKTVFGDSIDESVFSQIHTNVDRIVDSIACGNGVANEDWESLWRHHRELFGYTLSAVGESKLAWLHGWLNRILTPMSPVQLPDVPKQVLPIGESMNKWVCDLPSAHDIYNTSLKIDAATIARLALLMRTEQIEWLLRQKNDERLELILSMKKMVHSPWILSSIMVATVTKLDNHSASSTIHEGDIKGYFGVASSLVGPIDCAIILSLVLSAPLQQGVIYHLLEYLSKQPREFIVAVICEVCSGFSPRAMGGLLMRLLDLPNTHAAEPVRGMLERKLGKSLPVKKSSGSYYRECCEFVSTLLQEELDLYTAVKTRIQVCYRDHQRVVIGTPVSLVDSARLAITRADESSFSASNKDVLAHYRAAFRACSEAISADPSVMSDDWMKNFMKRNFDALTVLSVLDEYNSGTASVVEYIDFHSGANSGDVKAMIIGALFHDPKDRNRLINDPLIRLEIREQPRSLDFSVVFAMGVITKGLRGEELARTAEYVKRKWGVDIVRSDTGTGRTHNYNASRVIEAVKRVKTAQWGWLGYSQGCANALTAESRLVTGTPDERALVKGLTSRLLLFGCHNGSTHGELADNKIEQALVDIELSPFGEGLSSEALSMVHALMGSNASALVFGGINSLSHSGVLSLWRDGQFRPDTPSFGVIGALDPVSMPDSLKLMSMLLSRQSGSLHDSQVTVKEAQVKSIHVRNDNSDRLSNFGIDGSVQRCHHWSPLEKESAMLITRRDRERLVFESPKNRHVEPWIECMVRFGLIK